MTNPLDQSIAELLRASRADEATLAFPVPDQVFGFHAQQAVEKLLKALIGAHEQQYEFTHDLGRLKAHVEALREQIPATEFAWTALTDYAGIWRYQDVDVIGVEERDVIRRGTALLREYVMARLHELRPAIG